MKLAYKVTVPVFLGLVLVILSVAFISKYFVEEALIQEAFLGSYESVLKQLPKFLEAKHFEEPFAAASQKQFEDFVKEIKTTSLARVTIWNKQRMIVFSDLKSLIGRRSADHKDLQQLFSEERPFFIEKSGDDNLPLQSKVGEFLDIYIPVRVAREVIGGVQLHLVTAAVLLPIAKEVRYTTTILVGSGLLILVIVYALANALKRERDAEAALALQNAKLYDQTKEQALALEKSNRVKDEFLSVMSHELRTPLNIIMGYTMLIKEDTRGNMKPEHQTALETICVQSDELLVMINSIMEATTIECGASTLRIEEVSLRDFLAHLKSTCVVPAHKKVAMTWNLPHDLPAMRTDREKLRHILRNLINNAVKFTEQGSVVISVRYLPQASQLEFKVDDTGVGMERESLPVIFDKFRQLDGSGTRTYGGVGLGLHIVKVFTEMLGGKVEVESVVGKGSSFTVVLPVAYKGEPQLASAMPNNT